MGWSSEEIAALVAADLPDGSYVNLGIGMPTLVAQFVPPDRTVLFHSENGIIGMGPRPSAGELDPDLVDAGKVPVTLLPGAAIMDHEDSFCVIRGGRLDVAILGAFQVSEHGDLANWRLPDAILGSVGGAMDIALGARRTVVMMRHVDSSGRPKIVRRLTYPLTAKSCVSRIFTDLAVIDVEAGELVIRQLAPGISLPSLQAVSEPPLRISLNQGQTTWS